MIQFRLCILTAVASLTTLCAEPTPPAVDTESITVFEAGTPATATDMNDTIGELIRVINEQAVLLETATTSVAELTVAINEQAVLLDALREQTTTTSVAGRTYKLIEFGVTLETQLNSNTTSLLTNARNGVVTLTFNEDGTVSGSTSSVENEGIVSVTETTIGGTTSFATDVQLQGPTGEPESFSDSYIQTGNTVSALGLTFYVSSDGNSIVANVREHKNENEHKRLSGAVLSGIAIN
jgi:hypothetical protein